MLTVVVYDISDNTSRSNLIKQLQHFGLHRIQKSVFIGYLDLESRLDLSENFELYLSSDKDSVILFPFCESCKDSILLSWDVELPAKEQVFRFI